MLCKINNVNAILSHTTKVNGDQNEIHLLLFHKKIHIFYENSLNISFTNKASKHEGYS